MLGVGGIEAGGKDRGDEYDEEAGEENEDVEG